MRRGGGHRADTGSQAIVRDLRKAGISVEVIGRPVDLLCGFQGKNYLVELKAEGARKRKDQPKQDEFLANWPGQVAKVKTLDEALRICGVRT
ncbi:MAG: hypothetical protein NUW01_06600 [Gemmatimonadaceae bacterium]|nr:hypothetical protein [Gemmatimonadaceae bacterium]